jgi:hypothetical protein
VPAAVRPTSAKKETAPSDSTLAELAERFGLSRPDSVPNLTRRIDAHWKRPGPITESIHEILDSLRLTMPENERPRKKPTTKNKV